MGSASSKINQARDEGVFEFGGIEFVAFVTTDLRRAIAIRPLAKYLGFPDPRGGRNYREGKGKKGVPAKFGEKAIFTTFEAFSWLNPFIHGLFSSSAFLLVGRKQGGHPVPCLDADGVSELMMGIIEAKLKSAIPEHHAQIGDRAWILTRQSSTSGWTKYIEEKAGYRESIPTRKLGIQEISALAKPWEDSFDWTQTLYGLAKVYGREINPLNPGAGFGVRQEMSTDQHRAL